MVATYASLDDYETVGVLKVVFACLTVHIPVVDSTIPGVTI